MFGPRFIKIGPFRPVAPVNEGPKGIQLRWLKGCNNFFLTIDTFFYDLMSEWFDGLEPSNFYSFLINRSSASKTRAFRVP